MVPLKTSSSVTLKRAVQFIKRDNWEKATSRTSGFGEIVELVQTGDSLSCLGRAALTDTEVNDSMNKCGDNTLEVRSRPGSRREVATASVGAFIPYRTEKRKNCNLTINPKLFCVCQNPYKGAKRFLAPPNPLIQLSIYKVCCCPLYFIRTNLIVSIEHALF